MLDDIKNFVESHPYWIGGGVVLILVIYLISSSSTASSASSTAATSSGGVSDTVAVAQLQAASSVAATQASAQAANNQLSAQLQSQQLTDSTQITLAQIAKGQTPAVTTAANPPVASPPRSTNGHPRHNGTTSLTPVPTSTATLSPTFASVATGQGVQYPSSGIGVSVPAPTFIQNGMTVFQQEESAQNAQTLASNAQTASQSGFVSTLFGAGTSYSATLA